MERFSGMADNGVKLQRKIIHIDFDAFFAAIEIRDNPGLSGRPIAVGGTPEKRGVIATCSYEARRFGVHSAMASGYAKRLCPDLLIIPPRFSVYKDISKEAHDIFYEYTEQVEPLSLDEAYLNVSDSKQCSGSATLIAKELRHRIFKKIGVTVSAGVAPNKFLAKIASDWQKPDGLYVITPDQVDRFIFELPVAKIPGVGKVTAAKLHKKGVETCGTLQQYSKIELSRWFGSFGHSLWERARGIDNRPVESSRRRKSLSLEHTYREDLPDSAAVLEQVGQLLKELEERYQPLKGRYIVNKRFVKVKFADFTQTTLEEVTDQKGLADIERFRQLFIQAWERGEKPVRLLGIGVRFRNEEDKEPRQIELFEKKGGNQSLR